MSETPGMDVPDVEIPDVETPATDQWADPAQPDNGPALPSMPTPGSDEGEPDIGWAAAADDIETEAATLRQQIEGGQYARYPSLEAARRQELAALEQQALEYRAHVLAQEQVLWDQTLAYERGRSRGWFTRGQEPTQGGEGPRRRMGGPQQTAASEQAVRDAAKHGQPRNPIGGGSGRRKRRNPLGAKVADGNGQGRGLAARLGALINIDLRRTKTVNKTTTVGGIVTGGQPARRPAPQRRTGRG